MPYQPYDTGWCKFIYGGICLTWFFHSRGLLPHIVSVLCYNNMFIPIIEILNRFCELIGNIIVSFGALIVRCESTIFNNVNYIYPIFTGIIYIESLFNISHINIGPPKVQHHRSNTRRRNTSTGKHLCSFYARKHLRRRRFVISGSISLKNDNSTSTGNATTNTESIPIPQCTETYSNNFYPIDNPSCHDNTWYDAISPYWTGTAHTSLTTK
jgi:hypothetical protein